MEAPQAFLIENCLYSNQNNVRLLFIFWMRSGMVKKISRQYIVHKVMP